MTVYICGDSFAYPDPESGPNWADLLAQQLPVVNLSRVCASNLHIALQVEQALSCDADFVIYLATSSVRESVLLHQGSAPRKLLDRFADITDPDPACDLVSYSRASLDSTTLFDHNQLAQLRQYHLQFTDWDLAIYNNQLIIEATLARLHRSGCGFLFDQGGFEHPSFGCARQEYFQSYNNYRSKICLWDFVAGTSVPHRPYYHITDSDIHRRVADYYYNAIQSTT